MRINNYLPIGLAREECIVQIHQMKRYWKRKISLSISLGGPEQTSSGNNKRCIKICNIPRGTKNWFLSSI